jgi:hypothetical protein
VLPCAAGHLPLRRRAARRLEPQDEGQLAAPKPRAVFGYIERGEEAIEIDREFLAVVGTLEAAGLDYAVVGGFAVAIWGAPRATVDIDLLVRPEDVDPILAAVRPLGYTIEALPMKFQDGVELRRVTRIDGEELATLDLLLVNVNLESVWQSRRQVATDAGRVKVVSREALIRMKASAGRPQDVSDIQRLQDLDR